MAYAELSDEAWRRIWACLAEHPGLYVKQEAPTRRFIEAVLWMARAGASWRMLPAEFGPWNSVYNSPLTKSSLSRGHRRGRSGRRRRRRRPRAR